MRWMIAAVALIGGLWAVAWGVMVRMPGTNFEGSPVVMTADEVALRDELRRDVTELAGRIGERNLVEFKAL